MIIHGKIINHCFNSVSPACSRYILDKGTSHGFTPNVPLSGILWQGKAQTACPKVKAKSSLDLLTN
jgi:hypothetical protein